MQRQQTGNPRDFYLSRHDIGNFDVKLQQDKWRLHKNQAQSVRQFAEQNVDMVILYQEQKLHKGAAEQLEQAARTRAAVELQAGDIMERSGAENGARVSNGGVSALAAAGLAAERIGAPQKLQDPYYSDFLIGLMTPEQQKLLVEFGHGRHMHIDATHGTNNAKVLSPSSCLMIFFKQFLCTM
jgi:hypothetical protein